MNKDIVLRFITMPMAIKVFKQDKEQFSKSKVNILYYDLIDSILDKLEKDFNQLKADMFTKYHLDLKYLGEYSGVLKYTVNKEVVEFKPEELKVKTEELMREYIVKVDLKRKDRIWEQ